MPPYDCNECWGVGHWTDYRNGNKGKTVTCTCGAGGGGTSS